MMSPRTNPHRKSNKRVRHGAVLVCVLVCLTVVAALMASMMKSTLLARKQFRTERHSRQVEWLLYAGLERAQFQLQRDPNYVAETWKIDAEKLQLSGPAKISITARNQEESNQKEVTIVAEFPAGTSHSIQRTRSFIVQPPSRTDEINATQS